MIILSGCSSTPPVQLAATSKSQFDGAVYSGETTQIDKPSAGTDAFRAFYQGGTGFVSVASVRRAVDDMAARHCARQGRGVRPLYETTSKGPHILGNFPRVELVFECVDNPSSAATSQTVPDRFGQLERLKKLLDSGALNQQEFDREKAKVLSTQ